MSYKTESWLRGEITLGLGESRSQKYHLPWKHPGGESWSLANRQENLKAHRGPLQATSECLAEGIQARAIPVLQSYCLTIAQQWKIFFAPLLGRPKSSSQKAVINPLHSVF